MTRKESRELAFIVLFEMTITEDVSDNILDTARESRDIEPSDFALELIMGTENNLSEIDEIISKNIKGWNISRLSKVSLAVLRLAIFELKFLSTVPVSVSINEAVELTKTYGGKDDAPYVNGVLSSVAKNKENICKKNN